MAGIKCVMFVVVVTFPWTLTRGDEVSCVFMKSCILPCSFQPGSDVVIHWIRVSTRDQPNQPIHSYYHNEDKLSHQDQRFRTRTSLLKDQISRGNASLQLTGVEFQDEGRYKCYTSTITAGNKETFINVKVDAPVNKVNIEQVENRITCSSNGIYPEPELIWSTNPPSTLTLEAKTTVQQTEQQLYCISSLLILSDSVTDLDYICTVSTNRNERRTTLLKSISITVSETENTIPCTSRKTNFSGLIWRFNHSQIILNQTRSDTLDAVSENWRQHVKYVSKSGSLTLQDLSVNQEGLYTCEYSTTDETYITTAFVNIKKDRGKPAKGSVFLK
uniref:HERV-H LTR-associating 2b, tandem duplicate 2 n=1 Tax=Mastacembelus armatus TaxID=205130 RepID=A0A3Q3LYW2_9TELE